jgi:hypothetical protein
MSPLYAIKMIKSNPVKLDDVAVQPPCVAYRIPLEEINMARQGVPAEQLTKISGERIVPDDFGGWIWKKRNKES